MHGKTMLSLNVETKQATLQRRMHMLANSAFYECENMYSFVNITSSFFEKGG